MYPLGLTITPEPRLAARSGSSSRRTPKKCRNRGSSRNGWRGLTQLDDLESGTRTTEPLRLQRGDDEKHAHRNGGRLGKDEPEIAHGLSGRCFGGDLGCLSAAVRPRGMRGATRTPLVPRLLRKTVERAALPQQTAARAFFRSGAPAGIGVDREFAIRINGLGHKIWSRARLSV